MAEFNPVEKYDHFPYNVNWKMLAIGEFAIICLFLFGIWHSSGAC